MFQERIAHILRWRDWLVRTAKLKLGLVRGKAQVPFGPLEIGDVLVFENKDQEPWRAKVIGVPMEVHRTLGGKQAEPARYISIPSEERKTGSYQFRNINIPFRNNIPTFMAYYTGESINFGGNVAHVWRIAEVIRADGTREVPHHRLVNLTERELRGSLLMERLVRDGKAKRVKVTAE